MISVIVCTRNRAESLAQTLNAFRHLQVPQSCAWELIVVDNGSTDSTSQVVQGFLDSSSIEGRYVFEAGTGASLARNTGMRCAHGPVLAFVDDDMVVAPDWLAKMDAEAGKYPEVAMFFGQTQIFRPDQADIAVRLGDRPETFVFPCNPGNPGSSNNMIARKDALAAIGGFDTSLGPGSPFRAAEDRDCTYRMLRSGVVVRYSPAILAYHDHNRLTPEKVRAIRFDYALGAGAFYCKHVLRRDLWALKLCYWEIKSFFRLLWRRRQVAPVANHLSGLAAGFLLRFVFEVKAIASSWRLDAPAHQPETVTKDCSGVQRIRP